MEKKRTDMLDFIKIWADDVEQWLSSCFDGIIPTPQMMMITE